MNAFFLKIVNMSISASWVVLAVLLLRLSLKKAPKWVSVLLWGIVAVRLICPFSIESPVSMIPDAVGNGELVSEWTDDYIGEVSIIHDNSAHFDAAVAAGREPISDGSGGYYVVTKHDQLDEPSTVENTVIPVLSIVWTTGIVLLALYTAVSYWRLCRSVDTAVLYQANIFQSENISSPFVLGIVKPRIYLPFTMNAENLEHVVAHEQAHIRRKDHWWKPLGFLLLTIHWFNPFMWVAYVLLCRDIELACDEKVIKALGNEQRADYTQALVACSVNRRMITACPLAFGEVGVKERVKSVLNYKKPTFWVILIAIILCVVISVCFLTDPSGMHLYEINDSRNYGDLLTGVEEISLIRNGTAVAVSDPEEILEALEEVMVRDFTLMRTRSEDRDKTNQIKLKNSTYLNFSWDYSRVWIDNGMKPTYTYRVLNPGRVAAIFENYGNSTSITMWFDDLESSNDLTPLGGNEVQLPGLDGVTLRYTSDHEIIADNGNGSTFVMQGWPIRNVFFTDLSGDRIPEICATANYGFGLIDTRVIVFDYAAGERYELENRGTYDYALSVKNGELIVTQTAYANGDWIASGPLALAKDAANNLQKPVILQNETETPQNQNIIVCVDLYFQKRSVCLTVKEDITTILSLIEDIQANAQVIPEEDVYEQVNGSWHDHFIFVNYAESNQQISISKDCTLLWTEDADGAKQIYSLSGFEELQEYLEKMTDGVTGEIATGNPFATKEEPWSWTKNISTGAVEEASIYRKYWNADFNRTSTSFGTFTTERFAEMIGVLNAIPADAFVEKTADPDYDYSTLYSALLGSDGISASIIDRVNSLAVVFIYTGRGVEMAVCDDLEKVEQTGYYKLKDTYTFWTVHDEALAQYMQALIEDPPIITYHVGSSFEWGDPVEYAHGAYSLRLDLIEGWEYEIIEYSPDSQSFGIRCRPSGVSGGWLYFSFWPDGYNPQEEDRYHAPGAWQGYPSVRSYPAHIATVSTRREIWSYYRVRTDNGDFAIINEGADDWFLEYYEAIDDTVILCSFSVGE